MSLYTVKISTSLLNNEISEVSAYSRGIIISIAFQVISLNRIYLTVSESSSICIFAVSTLHIKWTHTLATQLARVKHKKATIQPNIYQESTSHNLLLTHIYVFRLVLFLTRFKRNVKAMSRAAWDQDITTPNILHFL